jgi:hypothetical protein
MNNSHKDHLPEEMLKEHGQGPAMAPPPVSRGEHPDFGCPAAMQPNQKSILTQEYIEIPGAPENNLKVVSLRIPKRKITEEAKIAAFVKKAMR